MPKQKQFYIENQVKEDPNAPVVGGEFITEDGGWQGQTVEVKSEKHLEDDLGTGQPIILRTFQFAVNPEAFNDHKPTTQEIFDSHKRGIAALLWQDGLTPYEPEPPKVVFSKEGNSYFIIVASIPQMGQTVLETPQTLSQIAHGHTTGHSQ